MVHCVVPFNTMPAEKKDVRWSWCNDAIYLPRWVADLDGQGSFDNKKHAARSTNLSKRRLHHIFFATPYKDRATASIGILFEPPNARGSSQGLQYNAPSCTCTHFPCNSAISQHLLLFGIKVFIILIRLPFSVFLIPHLCLFKIICHKHTPAAMHQTLHQCTSILASWFHVVNCGPV